MPSPVLLLLIQGTADDKVLFANSTCLIDMLVNRGVRFDFITYPGVKSGIATRAGKRHVDSTIEASANCFAECCVDFCHLAHRALHTIQNKLHKRTAL